MGIAASGARLSLTALQLLFHPDPGVLLNGRYPAVLKDMTISKTFLLGPFTARLSVECPFNYIISKGAYHFLITDVMLNRNFEVFSYWAFDDKIFLF